MERTDSSPRNREEERSVLSCWGRLKLNLPWAKRRIGSSYTTNRDTTSSIQKRVGWSWNWNWNNIAAAFTRTKRQQRTAAVGYGYDPLSYAQNFDDGCLDDENEDGFSRGFSSRFAPPQSRSLQDHK
ncbi:hypothetical protein JCGZ_15924 [Jatropha curcas]|uniref:Uncharacterized protein n=1 Tax=Jatropha curcas TaxID=180498 RepID=A0A067KZA7_JATCU|nr:hypothetical protein JCGZ_15924 [Jatropha curcas]